MATRFEKRSFWISMAVALIASPLISYLVSVEVADYQMKQAEKLRHGEGIKILLDAPTEKLYDFENNRVTCVSTVSLINTSKEPQYIQKLSTAFGIKSHDEWNGYWISQSLVPHGFAVSLDGGVPVKEDTRIRLEPNEPLGIHIRTWRGISEEEKVTLMSGYDVNGNRVRFSPLADAISGKGMYPRLKKYELNITMYYLTSTFEHQTVFAGTI